MNFFKRLTLGTMLAGSLVSAVPANAAMGLDGLRDSVATGISDWIGSWFGSAPQAQENAANQKLSYIDSPNFSGTPQQRDMALLAWFNVHKPTTSGAYPWKYLGMPRPRDPFYKPKNMDPGAMWRRNNWRFHSDAYGGSSDGNTNNNGDDYGTNDPNNQGAGSGGAN